ncbi:hypothetical protein KFL_006100030 [Klebsormidium nitens]|uniref:Uncharacterized protein n=1 Tax=Klebsormidium nitens TaxID=105231 RepID=A0A1Y1IH54_KLENI|nr:hypothetical protein KFL_006100030 [Klebsormidium nitens]|eukprot:GAQ90185.1 hypothetical protein KFL_006100030 [Klebsormidium nitens]
MTDALQPAQSNQSGQKAATALISQTIDAPQTALTVPAAPDARNAHSSQTAQTAPIPEPTQGAQIAQTAEIAQIAPTAQTAPTMVEPPPALNGRDFTGEEPDPPAEIQQLGGGGEELTSAYVTGPSSAELPAQISDGLPKADGRSREATPSVRAVDPRPSTDRHSGLVLSRAPTLPPKSSALSSGSPVGSLQTPRVRTGGSFAGQTEPPALPLGYSTLAGPGGAFPGQIEPPSLEQADSRVTSQCQMADVPRLLVAATPLRTHSESESPLVRPGSRPRAPYNPLAMTRSRIPASSGEQSASFQASSAPLGPLANVPESARQTAEPHNFPAQAVSITGRWNAPADVENLATELRSEGPEARPGAQRSPEPERCFPDLPAILSLLLPAEEKRNPQSFPDVSKRLCPASSTPEAQGASHVAALDSAQGGSRAAAVAESLPAHIRYPLEKHAERNEERNAERKPSLAAQKVAKQELREDDTCCVGFESPKNAALVPCGHRLCFECSNLVEGKIEGRMPPVQNEDPERAEAI